MPGSRLNVSKCQRQRLDQHADADQEQRAEMPCTFRSGAVNRQLFTGASPILAYFGHASPSNGLKLVFRRF